MRKLAAAAAASTAIAAFGTASASAASNPNGTGQPSQSCGSATASHFPNGFLTGGFANAESQYAGSDGTPSLANSQSGKAVSQYDVACFQTSPGH
jgi:hypothetical protein